ncbi:MAG TPA: iron-containing alcohol dehydrogenase [Planctomycetota bacterium]|nr:iron-containing alcohol dehydrogenase [Planctomycetota bacterium]
MTLSPFEYRQPVRLVYGENSIERLGDLVREHGGTKVLLVTDKGIVQAGHAERAAQSISKAGLSVATFDGVDENPTTRHVSACVEFAKKHDVTFIVGLGGGSSMDTAKGANFVLSNGGKMADYWGTNRAAKPMLPFIAVPTTAGTGSECQSYALISDEDTHRKMACGDDKAYARVALLDPVLTVSQPLAVTANTGIDTITHALEAHVTTARTPVSQIFSRESWRLAEAHLETVLHEPKNIAARGAMQLASAYGGMAIAQSMLGAAHSAANPLTAVYNVVHGQAVGIMLPHVVRFNAQDTEAALGYADLACAVKIARGADDPRQAVDSLLERLFKLLAAAHIPESLEQCGAARSRVPELAEDAARQWTARFNPRKIGMDDFRALYESAFHPRPMAGADFAQFRQRREDR